MKPYSKSRLTAKERIFNYRLSRARGRVENAFGILACRFRVFLRDIELKTSTIDKVLWAACSLHNWLRLRNPQTFISLVDKEHPETGELIPGQWRKEICEAPLKSVDKLGSNNYTRKAEDIRTSFADYFMDQGSISWQWKKAAVSNSVLCTSEWEEENEDIY